MEKELIKNKLKLGKKHLDRPEENIKLNKLPLENINNLKNIKKNSTVIYDPGFYVGLENKAKLNAKSYFKEQINELCLINFTQKCLFFNYKYI